MRMKRIKNNAIIQAMLFGSATGILGVLLFVFLLKMPSSTTLTSKSTEQDIIPVQTTEEQQQEEVIQVFYALQHGVFSTSESATQHVASYPTLNKAAIIAIDGQYFVWSRLDIEKVESALTVVPSAFYKKMTLQSSCSKQGELQLPKTLKDSKWLTLQATEGVADAAIPEDWQQRVEETRKLSTNPSIIRLHLLNNYFEQLDCLKITF